MLTLAVQAFAAQAPASGAAPAAAESNKRELQGWYQEPSVLSSTWTEAHAQQQHPLRDAVRLACFIPYS